jgi:hypothetical protein
MGYHRLMPTKKNSKKYQLTRSDIVDRIQEIMDRLADVDTMNTAPSDVDDEVVSIRDDLAELQDEVTDEAS